MKFCMCTKKLSQTAYFLFFFSFTILVMTGAAKGETSRVGLVAEYHFDGDANDSSGNGNNGMIFGAGFVDGVTSQALSFDGVDDYVSIPDSSSLAISGPLTVSFWVKTVSTENDKGLLSKWVYGSGYLFYDVSNKARFVVDSSATWADTTSNINDGRWHNVVGVYTNATAIVYFDGVKQGEVEKPIITASNLPLEIGRYGQDNRYAFNGVMDEIRIYNRALSADEIRANYNSLSGLVAEYHFDGDANDSSGNGNNGTVYGATFVDGLSGKAVNFGGDDYVDIGALAGLPLDSNWTVSFWMNSADVSNYRNPFDANFYAEGNNQGPRFEQYDNKGLSIFLGETASNFNGVVFDSAVEGFWYHVAGVKDGNTLRVYVNGTQKVELNNDLWPPGFNNVNIGRGFSASPERWFRGKIDELKIYNRALSPDEITMVYNNLKPQPVPEPIGNRTCGNVVIDDFESGTLDRWIVIGNPHSDARVSTAQAHGGNASLYLNLVDAGAGEMGHKEAIYNFAKAEQGRLSVWFYDLMDAGSSVVNLVDTAYPYLGTHTNVGIGAVEYSGFYQLAHNGAVFDSFVPRSVGWHKFELDVSDNGTRYIIDGIDAGLSPDFTSMKSFELAIGWVTKGEVYFDDVTLNLSSFGGGNCEATPPRISAILLPTDKRCADSHILNLSNSSRPSLSIGSENMMFHDNCWYNKTVTARFTCADSGLGVVTPSFDIVLNTEGANQSATGTCRDNAGNEASMTVSGINIDLTPPIISGTRTPDKNENGWNNESVAVHFSCVDALSGVYAVTGDSVVAGEGADQSVSGNCVDNAGNSAEGPVSGISIDLTPPLITGSATTLPNEAGWYNTDVVVGFAASDSLSGLDFVTPDTALTAEGYGQYVSGIATDKAGNTAKTTAGGLNIDKTAPILAINVPVAGAIYLLNQVVASDWSAFDPLSGISSATGTVPAGALIDTRIVGAKTFNISAIDNAGNQAGLMAAYQVRYNFSGFLNPINADGTSIFKGNVIPVKFQLTDANNSFVANATAKLYISKLSDAPIGNETEADSNNAATSGNQFKYDNSTNQYTFNLGTNSMSPGTWQLRVALDDGTSKYVNISFIPKVK